MAIRLTVTAKGQVTLRREVLEHLGVRPGDQIDVDLLPGRRMEVRAPAGTPVQALFGLLKRSGQPVLSIDEISAATAQGWAGRT
jgi:bifunctional DNA-binding transcriptional regulator/antitoxin component of YhaV-PrlF toxin-antitoxin module